MSAALGPDGSATHPRIPILIDANVTTSSLPDPKHPESAIFEVWVESKLEDGASFHWGVSKTWSEFSEMDARLVEALPKVAAQAPFPRDRAIASLKGRKGSALTKALQTRREAINYYIRQLISNDVVGVSECQPLRVFLKINKSNMLSGGELPSWENGTDEALLEAYDLASGPRAAQVLAAWASSKSRQTATKKALSQERARLTVRIQEHAQLSSLLASQQDTPPPRMPVSLPGTLPPPHAAAPAAPLHSEQLLLLLPPSSPEPDPTTATSSSSGASSPSLSPPSSFLRSASGDLMPSAFESPSSSSSSGSGGAGWRRTPNRPSTVTAPGSPSAAFSSHRLSARPVTE